ncbi:hypothetical protein CCACVL1_13273, partial [Corchorus capsularis]
RTRKISCSSSGTKPAGGGTSKRVDAITRMFALS